MVLKKFKFTICCVILIFYLCLFTPPKTRLDEISNIDKLYHFIMYFGTMSVFWWEYWQACKGSSFRISPRLLLLLSMAAPILLSGAIELIQAYCTQGRRSGEWADFLANSLGVLLAYPFGRTCIRMLARCIRFRSASRKNE